jgi:hypothetical protein
MPSHMADGGVESGQLAAGAASVDLPHEVWGLAEFPARARLAMVGDSIQRGRSRVFASAGMLLGRLIHSLTHRPVGLAASSLLGPGQLGTLTAGAISVVLGSQNGLDADRLRRAEQIALRPEVDRICRCERVPLSHSYAEASISIRDQNAVRGTWLGAGIKARPQDNTWVHQSNCYYL